MKRFVYSNEVTGESERIVTENDADSIGVFDKYKAYKIIFTLKPLPACLPQKLSINEMDEGDIIKNDNWLLVRES